MCAAVVRAGQSGQWPSRRPAQILGFRPGDERVGLDDEDRIRDPVEEFTEIRPRVGSNGVLTLPTAVFGPTTTRYPVRPARSPGPPGHANSFGISRSKARLCGLSQGSSKWNRE